jgi:hypothetical protein
MKSKKINPNIRQPSDILALLPAPVMDSLVEDLAEAVVAILLHPKTASVNEKDESSNLRKI